jgi:hypothetical protein
MHPGVIVGLTFTVYDLAMFALFGDTLFLVIGVVVGMMTWLFFILTTRRHR